MRLALICAIGLVCGCIAQTPSRTDNMSSVAASVSPKPLESPLFTPMTCVANTANQVSTLSWKPPSMWQWYDVTLAENGDFFFSPLIPSYTKEIEGVRGDSLVRIKINGKREIIRTGPEAPIVPTHERTTIPYNLPGDIAVIKNYIWINDFKNGQLRRIQFEHPLKEEAIIETDPSLLYALRLVSTSNSRLYGYRGCAIYQLDSKPYTEVFSGVVEGNQCISLSLNKLIAGSSQTFFMPALDPYYGLDLSPEDMQSLPQSQQIEIAERKRRVRETLYQIHRIKNNQTESWAGSPEKGFKDGFRSQARFGGSLRLAVARDNTLYVADRENHAIRMVSPTGQVSTLIGNGQAGFANGDIQSAKIDTPSEIFLGPCHKLYVFDVNGIREISLPPGPSSERWGEPVPTS